MSKNTFEDIYKSVKNLEAGTIVNFNEFPMVVREWNTTYNRYYGEMMWVKQLDGELNIDVTLNVKVDLDGESAKQMTSLKEENARLKAEVKEARKISGKGMSVTLDLNNQLCSEVERLKNEVNRLTDFTTRTIVPNEILQEQVKVLTEELEAYQVNSVHSCSRGCKKKGCSRGLRDEIEDLKAKVNSMTWKPISTRPEGKVTILVAWFIKDIGLDPSLIAIAESKECVFFQTMPTHWMPLPALPQSV